MVNEISGGEQQKVAIARAIAQDTDWILLDEPAQSLDPYAREQIFDLMQKLTQSGKTLIASTHHLDPCQHTRTIGIGVAQSYLMSTVQVLRRRKWNRSTGLIFEKNSYFVSN